MKGIHTILLLILSISLMTFAWYGHLKFREISWSQNLGLLSIILISWGGTFFEYCFQFPANRIGYKENGRPFLLIELKVVQEVITLIVFFMFSVLLFRNKLFRMDHFIGGSIFPTLAVYFIF